MSRIFLLLALAFAACNNSGSNSSSADSTGTTNTGKNYSWPKEDENEFLADCVAGASRTTSEDTAYAKCNCVLKRLKQEFPNLDSASAILNDTTRAAAYTKPCQTTE